MKPFAIVMMTFATLASAQQRFDMEVRNDFFAGFAGNKEALERGMKATEAVLAANPNHAEALVWHGAGVYFLSGQAFQKGDQATGMELYGKGLAEMDKAVALAPKHIGVRIPRGATLLQGSLYMPQEFAKPLVERGLADYRVAYDLQKDDLALMGEHPKGELLMGLASANQRLGNPDKAREFYQKVAELMPNTPYAKKAAQWLETGKLSPREQMCLGCHAATKPAQAQ